jgi:hypothetical protein
MLRLFLISLPIALLMLGPMVAQQQDFMFPGQGIIRIPATGLDYMAVFFHELGHTVTHWAFGEPAIPTFDWDEGGGMTYGFDRSWLMQGAIWALMASGLLWLWKNGGRGLFFIAAGIVAFLFAASFSDTWREGLGAYMGHGGEILIACFCILRALTNTVDGDKAVERPLAMIFGLYTLGRNALLCRSLFTPEGREMYDGQKAHVQGDFRHLSELLNMKIEHVAGLSLLFMAAMVAVTLILAWWLRDETG